MIKLLVEWPLNQALNLLDLQPPALGENKFLLFQPLKMWYFILAALKIEYTAHTLGLSICYLFDDNK